MLTYGSLFSGIGGIDLGLDRAGMQCKWQVEIDEYATKVLAKHWPDVARFRDVRTVGKHNLTSVDLICGGFPCQDISVAGKRAGIDGERSGLWREFYRIICELRPRYILVENVPALLNGGIDRVLGNLAASGYDAEWQVLSAASIGAPHLRERIYIVAYPNSIRCNGSRTRNTSRPNSRKSHEGWNIEENSPVWQGKSWFSSIGAGTNVADANGVQWNGWNELANGGQAVPDPDRQGLAVGQVFGSYARQELTSFKRGCSKGTDQWATEPNVGRVANGVPHRVDRLRGLGNAVVPQIAEYIGNCIVAAVQANQEEVAV